MENPQRSRQHCKSCLSWGRRHLNFLLIVYCHLILAILPTQCVRDLRPDFFFFSEFCFYFIPHPPNISAELRIFRPSVSSALCQRSFFFPLSPPLCSDVIPLSQWVFARVNQLSGEAWCNRTDRWVDPRGGRETICRHGTDQVHRGSFPSVPSWLLSSLMLLLSHCTDDKCPTWCVTSSILLMTLFPSSLRPLGTCSWPCKTSCLLQASSGLSPSNEKPAEPST